MPAEIMTPTLPKLETDELMVSDQELTTQSENTGELLAAKLKDLTPNPLRDFWYKLTKQVEPVIRKICLTWQAIEEKTRKKILLIVSLLLLVLSGFWIWKLFFGGSHTDSSTPKAEPIIERTAEFPLSNQPVPHALPTPNSQLSTNNDNRIIPALNTNDLESWSGLQKDTYEMKKRGQLKTIPEKIIEAVAN